MDWASRTVTLEPELETVPALAKESQLPLVLESGSGTVLATETDVESAKVSATDVVPVLEQVLETEKATASAVAMVVSSAEAKAASAAEAKVVFEVEELQFSAVEQLL